MLMQPGHIFHLLSARGKNTLVSLACRVGPTPSESLPQETLGQETPRRRALSCTEVMLYVSFAARPRVGSAFRYPVRVEEGDGPGDARVAGTGVRECVSA